MAWLRREAWTAQAPVVLAIFITAQFLDGVLTYWGVQTLGAEVEANAYLAIAIQALGAAPALVAAKLLACVCGAILYITGRYRSLAIATGAYLGLAVIPWLVIVAISS